MDGHPNVLGPWNPLGTNSFDPKILIIGQDFGIVKYLEDAKNIDGLIIKEKNNSTNKKLIEYLKLAGVLPNFLY